MGQSEYLETVNYPTLDMPEGAKLKHREIMQLSQSRSTGEPGLGQISGFQT